MTPTPDSPLTHDERKRVRHLVAAKLKERTGRGADQIDVRCENGKLVAICRDFLTEYERLAIIQTDDVEELSRRVEELRRGVLAPAGGQLAKQLSESIGRPIGPMRIDFLASELRLEFGMTSSATDSDSAIEPNRGESP